MAVAKSTADPADDKFPKQIPFIVGNEACERYSFYGMKGILAGYITGEVLKGGLGQQKDTATVWIHLFIMVNYFTPLLGAYISDRIWGRYKTILWISLLYCAGHGVLAASDLFSGTEARTWMLWIGLTLIAFGAGGIKPCVSAFMGDQFKESQSRLYQKAYAAFYFSINFGSFFAFLTIPFIAKKYGYSWAFGIPGVLMAVATFIFWLGRNRYVKVPPARETKAAGFFPVLFAALGSSAKERPFWDRALGKFSKDEVEAARSVLPVLSVFALIPPFWAMFDQHSSTWIMQAKAMIPYKVTETYSIGGEEMQSLNPLLVMILVPVLTLGVYPLFGKLVTPLRRIGVGMFIAGGSYLVVAWIQRQIDAGVQMSVLWQAVPYTILTSAEVLVSVTGLEFAYTQAAKSMKSMITSFWLLTVAAGNGLVALITKFGGGGGHDSSVTAERFTQYSMLTFGVAVVFVFVAMAYRYRNTGEAKAP